MNLVISIIFSILFIYFVIEEVKNKRNNKKKINFIYIYVYKI